MIGIGIGWHRSRRPGLAVAASRLEARRLLEIVGSRDQKIDQLERRLAAELKLSDGLESFIEQLSDELQKAQRQALTDRLTGLGSSDAYQASIEPSDANPTRLAIKGDIDNFKMANDTHSDDFGDELLRRTGALIIMKALARGLHPRVLLRAGGDEFVIYVDWDGDDPDGQTKAIELAEQLVLDIQAGFAAVVDELCPDLPLSFSLGYGPTNAEANAAKKRNRSLYGTSLSIHGVRAGGGRFKRWWHRRAISRRRRREAQQANS
jgi:diguanylate cyclase (GGDEF)-like protein